MSTNYLSLRSTVTYVSSGVQPSVGTVYTVGSNGNPAWTSTLVSPVQFSTFLGSSLVTGSVGYSTLTGSTLYGNSGTVSTLTGSTFVTGSVGYSTLTGSTLYGNSGTISTLSGSTITTGTLGASGSVSIGTRLQASVDGSNNFWLSLQGSETEVNRVGIGIGGNPTTGTVSSLSFNAGGSNCMFIHSTGNVGIATTDPQALLDVRGRCYLGVSGNRYVELAADSSNTSYIDFHSQDSRATDYDTRIQSLGGTATDGQGSLEFYARNTLIKASTIGTSATATNSNYGLRISQVDTINSTVGQVIGQIGFEGAGRSVVSGFVRCLTDSFNGYDDAGGLAFGTSEGESGALERVRINESGFVGIGTTLPQNTLHIHNTTADHVRAPDGDPRSGQIVITNSKTGTTTYSMTIGMDQAYGIGFLNAAGNGSVQPICINTRGGFVGIGTTNPGAPLHVCKSTNYPEVYIEYTETNRVTLGCGAGGAFLGYSGYLVIGTMTGPQVTGFTEYMRVTSDGKLGIGGTPSYQLDLSTDGARKLTTSTWLTGSDARLKTNIQLADTARCYDIIKSVPLKRYTWRDDMDIYDSVRDRSKLGWIAQDVEAVFPKAVDRNSLKFNQKYEEIVLDDGKVEKKLISEEVIEDCLTLNADQIYAVMYGAVQSLIQKSEEKDLIITALEEKLSTTQEQLNHQTSRIESLLAWATTQGFAS